MDGVARVVAVVLDPATLNPVPPPGSIFCPWKEGKSTGATRSGKDLALSSLLDFLAFAKSLTKLCTRDMMENVEVLHQMSCAAPGKRFVRQQVTVMLQNMKWCQKSRNYTDEKHFSSGFFNLLDHGLLAKFPFLEYPGTRYSTTRVLARP